MSVLRFNGFQPPVHLMFTRVEVQRGLIQFLARKIVKIDMLHGMIEHPSVRNTSHRITTLEVIFLATDS